MKKRRTIRPAFLYLAFGLVVLVVGASWLRSGSGPTEIRLDEFQRRLAEGDVADATIKDRDNRVTGKLTDGSSYTVTYSAEFGDEITEQIIDSGVRLEVDEQHESIWLSLLFNMLPILLLFALFLFLLNSTAGGGGLRSFRQSRARRATADHTKATFSDVAGCDEAVEELQEIKEFLENPARFQAMGAKIPKGVLLFGPPGTGKTLLARAVAGEAGVPFFTISGSDFVEMFVGVGASRVRDLFEQAKQAAPAIVFVDEIDAVGRHRGAGMGGGHDEREQTLNQLLVEMDGFDARTGVILIAATNRPDILDPALLRPGRFDRQIVVDRPDLEGRKAILAVHARGKPLAENVRLDVLARRTPGFTGADLANLLNEAALLTTRRSLDVIGHAELEAAIDRVLAGPERKTRVMSDREKEIIAYHEAGHALVGHTLTHTDPIHKISIVARGRALGWTLALPTEDKYLRTRGELEDSLSMLLGGRTAEELVFGEITTGASDDIERCSEIARAMVTRYGMSDLLGPQQLGQPEGEVFLGRDYGNRVNYSAAVARTIDEEVTRLVDTAHGRARAILAAHRATLDHLARELVEKETLEDAALEEIFGELEKGRGDPPEAEPEPSPARRDGFFEAVVVAADAAPEPVPVPVAAPAREAPAPGGWRRLAQGWRRVTRPETGPAS